MNLLYIHPIAPDKNKANIIQVLQMCYAFNKNGVTPILAIPKEKDKTKDEICKILYKKLGKRPKFKIDFYNKNSVIGRSRVFGAYFGIVKILNKYQNKNIHVVFTRHILTNRVALKMGYNVIFESHATKLHNNILLNLYKKRILLKCSKLQNQILFITISNALREYWKTLGVPLGKIISLHDGVSGEDYIEKKSIIDSKKSLGLPLDRKCVVYAGSLYKDRGIDSLLRLASCFKDVNFIVVGGPEDLKKYYEKEAYKIKLHNIFFCGHVNPSEVKKYLFAADVLLMLWSWNVPTIHICSPLKVFEYMASERIIVGQDFPTIKEVLTDYKNALLAGPDSFEDLREKLRIGLSMNYPNSLSTQARKDVFEYYTWEKRTSRIIRAISEL